MELEASIPRGRLGAVERATTWLSLPAAPPQASPPQGASQINGGGPRFFHLRDDATKLRSSSGTTGCLAHPTLLLPRTASSSSNSTVATTRCPQAAGGSASAGLVMGGGRRGWRRVADGREGARLWAPPCFEGGYGGSHVWIWRTVATEHGGRDPVAAGGRRSDLAAELGFFFLHFLFFFGISFLHEGDISTRFACGCVTRMEKEQFLQTFLGRPVSFACKNHFWRVWKIVFSTSGNPITAVMNFCVVGCCEFWEKVSSETRVPWCEFFGKFFLRS